MHEADSRGRRYSEPAHPYRSIYARDRDRIIHARAFRRLEAKTQVFTTRYSDHFRNRLTHTLEVAQIARTVAAALQLNAELAEALALVHDIGHPPFGHAGERKLNELMKAHDGRFDHNLHALRIVEQFEQRYAAFPGLNLSFEVREGIIKHSRDYTGAQFAYLGEYLLDRKPPLEAQLIDHVDEIAYNTADLDDAREAELLDMNLLRSEVPLFKKFHDAAVKEYPEAQEKLQFYEAIRKIVDYLATDLVSTTQESIREGNVHSADDIRNKPKRLARLSSEAATENAKLKKFLFDHIFQHPSITDERDRSVQCLEELFLFYLNNPGAMPAGYQDSNTKSDRAVQVCDYIAGMTDQFLLRQHKLHFPDSHSS